MSTPSKEGSGAVPIRSEQLADAWQRLEWANADGNAFSVLRKRIQESRTYMLQTKFDGDRGETFFRCLIDPAAEAEQLSELARLLGSYLDHVRAALNYVTYQLALLAIREDPALKSELIPDSVEFPIFQDRDRFRKNNRIKKLPSESRRALEAVQPYDGRNQGLWMLHELAREYRHRVVHPAAIISTDAIPTAVLVDGRPLPANDVEIVTTGRLKDGDLALRFRVRPPVMTANVYAGYPIDIGIDHPICRNLGATNVLAQIRKEVGPIVAALERKFFGTPSE